MAARSLSGTDEFATNNVVDAAEQDGRRTSVSHVNHAVVMDAGNCEEQLLINGCICSVHADRDPEQRVRCAWSSQCSRRTRPFSAHTAVARFVTRSASDVFTAQTATKALSKRNDSNMFIVRNTVFKFAARTTADAATAIKAANTFCLP